jgi:hypothetical protein
MLQDLFAWLLATFVIEPVQAELASRMQAAQAPAAVVQQVQACLVSGTPALIARAADDPWWVISTSISVTVGLTDARTVLASASPECVAALGALQPFLSEPEA